MVTPDFDFVVSPLKIVVPFFEASHDSQHLLVVDVVVLFDVGKAFGDEGTGEPLVIFQNA